ncbi:MAG: hypothetical protein KFB96_02925 [Thiocapsa sp.]|uniref:hypothetical protein n=1 Tax=Thiocapsa sp. TaxID=2024551 RepID=UPI001BCFEAD5|nr:hypothetical protein [Thiocapsa sp.]QVL49489.1 MAG: hypothetical protein KFB96_02925 [Thiocapsa sp.]
MIRIDDDIQHAWIWPEGRGVCWWTPARTDFLDLATPCPFDGSRTVRELRDRRQRLSLRHGLAEPLAERIADVLRTGHRLCLHLSGSLDAIWQCCPYEWMSFDGQPVFGQLLVERSAPVETTPLPPTHPQRPIVILNLLSADEPIQPTHMVPSGVAQIIDGHAAVDYFLNKADVSALGALIVVAHGTESSAESPLRLPDGCSWALPTQRGLPPLVILMACGNDDGNLVWDAHRLLAAGARTVLAPLGRPCPEAAGRFIAGFLLAWQAGEQVGDILLDLQQASDSGRGARLMQVVGRADLRMSREIRLKEYDDEALAAAARDSDADALGVLINRLTLRCFQSELPLETAENVLRQLLQVGRFDAEAEKWLLGQLERQKEQCWLLSQAWSKALEALFAEAYDQRRLDELEQYRRTLERAAVVMPAPVYHYWSKIAYRQGRYAVALRDVAKGLSELQPADLCTRAAGLVGHLIGLLVDVNLPDPAAALHQQLDDCLANRGTEESDWERHKLQDRAARIALRQGQPQRAVAFFRKKRQDSIRFGGDGHRELAWLLYASAWCDPVDASPLATEAQISLAAANIQQQGLGPGNEDPVYLLRAYAAWAWRTGNADACRFLLGFRTLLAERLFTDDPGPPGFIFAFLHLCLRDGIDLPTSLPSWDTIVAAMEQDRYFLELAAFSALLGRRAAVASMLQRVQAQRSTETPCIFPGWLGGGVLTDWVQLTNERMRYEHAVLGGEQAVAPEQLVSSGLLPL